MSAVDRISEANGSVVPSPLRGEGGSTKSSRVRGKKLLPQHVARGRALRRKETEPEHRLWNMLRNRNVAGLKFLRQHPVGPYVVDFVCRDRMLVIEVDGSHHGGLRSDATRTRALNERGYSVLRFWNHEVIKQLGAVEQLLLATLAGDCPDPSPWRFAPSLSPEERGDGKIGE